MEKLIAKDENISKQNLHAPMVSANGANGHTQNQAADNGEETNTLTMVLITLAMIVLTVAVITKVFTMLASGLMSLVKSQLSWLHLQH